MGTPFMDSDRHAEAFAIASARWSLEQIGSQPQPPGELVFEDEVGLTEVADALLHSDIEVLADLLPDGDLRSTPRLRRNVDLERVEIEHAADGLRQLAGHDVTNERLSPLRQ